MKQILIGLIQRFLIIYHFSSEKLFLSFVCYWESCVVCHIECHIQGEEIHCRVLTETSCLRVAHPSLYIILITNWGGKLDSIPVLGPASSLMGTWMILICSFFPHSSYCSSSILLYYHPLSFSYPLLFFFPFLRNPRFQKCWHWKCRKTFVSRLNRPYTANFQSSFFY